MCSLIKFGAFVPIVYETPSKYRFGRWLYSTVWVVARDPEHFYDASHVAAYLVYENVGFDATERAG